MNSIKAEFMYPFVVESIDRRCWREIASSIFRGNQMPRSHIVRDITHRASRRLLHYQPWTRAYLGPNTCRCSDYRHVDFFCKSGNLITSAEYKFPSVTRFSSSLASLSLYQQHFQYS
jgi:hypothetical protein